MYVFENHNVILLYQEQRLIQIYRLIFSRIDLINMFYYVPLLFYSDRWNIKPVRNRRWVIVNLPKYELNRLNQWFRDDNDLFDFGLLVSLLNSSFYKYHFLH
jgi:hypothetical protein